MLTQADLIILFFTAGPLALLTIIKLVVTIYHLNV